MYGYEPWLVILVAATFEIFSTTNRLKGYTPGQFIFGRDMILPIKHLAYCELIRQRKQTQINRYGTRKNSKIVDHDNNIRDKVSINNKADFVYEIP